MKTLLPALLGMIFCAGATAQSIEAPVLKPGDSWTYRLTQERAPSGWVQSRNEFTVERVTASAIYYTAKQAGSSQTPREILSGPDWSRMRDVNGKETVVNRPLVFPLTTGKTWNLEYSELSPNKVHKSEQWSSKYTVVGYETVEVPAGKFNALKIEAEGHWTAEMEPGQSIVQGAQTSQNSTTMTTSVQRASDKPTSGRTYKAFWYAPEVRRWVKSVEEFYSSGGIRNERETAELEAFKVSQ